MDSNAVIQETTKQRIKKLLDYVKKNDCALLKAAETLGISKSTVKKWKQKGLLDVKVDPLEKIDWQQVVAYAKTLASPMLIAQVLKVPLAVLLDDERFKDLYYPTVAATQIAVKNKLAHMAISGNLGAIKLIVAETQELELETNQAEVPQENEVTKALSELKKVISKQVAKNDNNNR